MDDDFARAVSVHEDVAIVGAPNMWPHYGAAYVYDLDCSATCPDLDGDAHVGVSDLLMVLGAWGTGAGDVTGDGMTDIADLLALLGAWGPCA